MIDSPGGGHVFGFSRAVPLPCWHIVTVRANVDVVIAQEMGFFTQQALDVTVQNFDSGVKVVQAVVAHDVAIGGASIEPVVNASVAGGNLAI